jgi:hypothetical protein
MRWFCQNGKIDDSVIAAKARLPGPGMTGHALQDHSDRSRTSTGVFATVRAASCAVLQQAAFTSSLMGWNRVLP